MLTRIMRRTYEIIADPPEGDWIGNFFNAFILTLIAFNVVVGLFESIESLEEKAPNFFYYFEMISVIIFSVEYVLRIWSCTVTEKYKGFFKGRIRLALTPMALIDIFAILPFYLQVLVPGLDLRFIRVLRLFRLFRLFRVGRFSESFSTLSNVVMTRKEELLISVIVVIVMLVFSSSLMYLAEHGQLKEIGSIKDHLADHLKKGKVPEDLMGLLAQKDISFSKKLWIKKKESPDHWQLVDDEKGLRFTLKHEKPHIKLYAVDTQFTSVPASMWWGIITITTIGYGDMYPTTTWGRILGAFVGFLGICVFALPVGILGAGFIEEVSKKDKEKAAIAEAQKLSNGEVPANQKAYCFCPHCGEKLNSPPPAEQDKIAAC